MSESISPLQARKLVLLSQRLPPKKSTAGATDATLQAIEHLGYVQIDTISVVQRAHHHTLWSRNPRYQLEHLDELVEQKNVFEYWSHAAAYLPMRDYRYTLPRKNAIASGEQKHWYEPDKKMIKLVRDRITAEGPLMAKDFEHKGKKTSDWGSKPAKQALECLFMQGELMVPCRRSFHKVYDFTEKVLPAGIDQREPSQEDYARFLIRRYLEANGLGLANEMNYLLKNTKKLIISTLQDMVLDKELITVDVGGVNYYTLAESLVLISKPLSRNKLKILSPFDNLLIQRKRTLALFEFDYQIECYVPEKKRQYGYFSLPILWDGKLVARMDCKADRKEACLHIQHLALEPSLKNLDDFFPTLQRELKAFMSFNNCTQLKVHRIGPGRISKKRLVL